MIIFTSVICLFAGYVPAITCASTTQSYQRSAPRPAATPARPVRWVDYGPSCYVAFLIDPDGNHVEALWMG
jgi:hypothetical protein